MCRTFRGLFDAQAYTGRPLRLNLNSLSWRLLDRKGRPAVSARHHSMLTCWLAVTTADTRFNSPHSASSEPALLPTQQARRALLALLARVAPSVRDLHIRYQLDSSAGLTLEALLTPLAPHVQASGLPVLSPCKLGWRFATALGCCPCSQALRRGSAWQACLAG